MAESQVVEVLQDRPQASTGQEPPAAEAHPAELPEMEPRTTRAAGGQIDILLETTVEVSVRLGRATMPARELIQLGPGSVVALDRRAGEPVDLLLHGTKFAMGKLVVVGEQLGIKIEEILPPEDLDKA